MTSRLWKLREEYPVFVALTAVTVTVLAVWPVVDFYLRQGGIGIPYGFNDFGAYTSALQQWTEGGSVYTQTEAGGYHGSYLYPPVTILIFYPFSTLGFQTGAILMGGFSIVLLWVGLGAVARSLGYDLSPVERLIGLFAIFGFQPAMRDFKWAQIATLLAGILAFAFYAQELGAREEVSDWVRYASGALTTLGSAFKLFFATSGAHLLRDRKRFAGAMATAGVLLVASLAIFGVEAHRTYIDVLMWGKGWGDTRALYLWDVTAAYRPLWMLGPLGLPAKLLGVLGVIGLTLAARDADAPAARHATFALGVAIIPLAAPQADVHDLVIVLLPAVIMTAVEFDRPDGYPWLPVLAVLLVHFHRYAVEATIYAPDWVPLAELIRSNAALLQTGMWGTLLLAGLAAYRVAEYASVPAPLKAGS